MKSVVLEKCKLCKETRELKDSHVIPKLIYRYMRRYQDTTNNLNGLLILDSKKKKIDVTQRQWQDKLFCKECEEILSKNETKFARILHDINAMKKAELKNEFYFSDDAQLFEELRKEKSDVSYSEYKQIKDLGYFNDEKAETLKYFSASYVLRQLYLIENLLGQEEVSMLEHYLLGRCKGDFSLIVNLNYGQEFKAFCSSLPIDKLDDFKHYNFLVPEMWFHLIFDKKNKLGFSKVMIQPDDFRKNKVIFQLLSPSYIGASTTKKAKQALEK